MTDSKQLSTDAIMLRNIRGEIHDLVTEKVAEFQKVSRTFEAKPSNTSENWWTQISKGAKDPAGREIVEVVSWSPKYILYFDEHSNLVYDLPNKERFDQRLFIKFDKLQQKILRTLSVPDQRSSLKCLGRALSHALDRAKADTVYSCFDDINDFVNTKCREKLHKFYISSTFVFCVSSLIIFVILSVNEIIRESWFVYTISGVLGAVGALISVLQRFKKKQIQTYTSPSYIAFEGFSRIMIGACFGLISTLAIKGGVLLSMLADDTNINALALLAMIAGLSERFIPEFIETIESRNRRRTDLKTREND